MGFSRQEYWSALSCPPPEDLLNPGIEPRSLTLQADYLPSKPPGKSSQPGGGLIFKEGPLLIHFFSSIYQDLMMNEGIHVEVKTNQSHLTEHQRCVPGTAYQADTVFTLQVRRWRVRELV